LQYEGNRAISIMIDAQMHNMLCVFVMGVDRGKRHRPSLCIDMHSYAYRCIANQEAVVSPRRIFVSWPGYSVADPETGGKLVDAGYELILEPKLGARSAAELIGLMKDAAGAIVSTDPFTAEAIAANPSLKVIARVGVGSDSIDHDAARRAKVAITITPGMNMSAVADQTLAMMLAITRKVVGQDTNVKAGRWERVGAMTPSELAGKTVGLVGAGAIGQAVAPRVRAFDARVAFFDPRVDSLADAERIETLEQLLERADIVSLHVPLLPETRGLIDARAIARMKAGAVLINTARGGIVDEAALFEALRSGKLSGAALDVFETEPPDAAAIRDVPNLVCSAHMGGLSHESIRRMTVSATDSVLAVLSGQCPPTVINPEVMR
jgi:phosphoglycerate dehydrogenase-like enzyme